MTPIKPLVFLIEVWLRAGQTFKEPIVTYCVLNVSMTSQLVKLELSCQEQILLFQVSNIIFYKLKSIIAFNEKMPLVFNCLLLILSLSKVLH